jgi:hypothetical protein
MAAELITRQHLLLAGFTRMPDVWLYCPKRRRNEYFERWYHQDLSISVMPGYAGSEVLTMTLADLHDILAEAGYGTTL